jgi:HSP20 family molecular chaperone IbpA
MLNKKKCNSCKERINSNYEFCPHCGNPIKNSRKEWGLLGKDDVSEDNDSPNFLGGLGGNFIGKMIGNAMNMIEREMKKGIKEFENPRSRVKLIINGKEIDMNNRKKVKNQKVIKDLSKEKLEKFATLPKQEAKTSIRRLSDKLICEIELPGVKSIEDISVINLESSIEIKALAKDKVYIKRIPMKLPIINYSLTKGKLILELLEQNCD